MNTSLRPVRTPKNYTRPVAAALALMGLLPAARAQETFTWTGAGADGNWSTAANWSPGLPNGGGDDTLIFAGALNRTPNNDLAGWTGTSVQFNATALDFSLSGGALNLGAFGGVAPLIRNDSTASQTIGNALNLDGTTGGGEAVIQAAAGNLTFGGAVNLQGVTTLVLRGGGGRSITFSVPISGIGNGLRVAEANVVTLTGTNTYTGPTVVEAGELRVAGNLASASPVSIGAVATQGTAATFLLTNPAGGTNFGSPITIQPGSGSNRIFGATNTSGSHNVSGTITLAGGGDSTVSLTAAAGGTLNLLGAITGTSGINKIGGGVVQMFTPSTYTGLTTISNGTLRLGVGEVLPNSTGLVMDGGTFDLQGNNETVATVTLNNGSIIGTGTLNATSYTLRNGTISNILGGSGSAVKQGAGTVTLSGNNTFTGGLQVLEGVLTITADGALGGAANVITINGGRLNGGGTFTTNRAITLAANSANALGAEAGATMTVSGVLSGPGGVTKAGPGTVVLGGLAANTYAGLTVVTEGILQAAKTAGVNAIPGDLLIEQTGSFRLQNSNQIPDTATVTLNGGTFNNPADVNPPQAAAVDTIANLTINGGAFATNRSTGTFVVTNLLKVSSGTALVSRGGSLSVSKLELTGGSVNLDGGSATVGQESRLDVGAGGITIAGGQIIFNAGPSALTATSTGGLVRLNGNITSSGFDSFVRPVTAITKAVIDLQAGNRTIHVDNSLSIGGNDATTAINVANGGITKTGPGTLQLSGYDAGTAYNGGLVIQEGKVSFALAAALGGNTNAITINGSTLENTAGGEVIVSDATAARTFTVGPTGGILSATQPLGSTNFDRAGSLTGSGTITKEGVGIVRVRADNPTLTGNWVINFGTVEASTPLSLGSGTVTVNSGAMLAGRSSTTVDTPFGNAITLAGGTLSTRTGDFTNYTGPVSVTAPSFIGLRSYSTPANPQSFTISGLLSGGGDLSISGATVPALGKFLLLSNPANTYAGTIRVGTLQTLINQSSTGVGRTLGTGGVELSNALLSLRDDGTGSGGVLAYGNAITVTGTGNSQIDLNRATAAGVNTGNTFQLGSLTMGGQALILNGLNGYKVQFAGNTTLTGNATLALNNTDAVLSGPVGGAFGLTKTGSGKLTLGGANTYTGPTNVLSGVLQFNQEGGTGSIFVVRGSAVVASFALNQAFIARISPISDGILALGTNSAGNLDFSATGANLPFIRLGAAARAELGGSLVMANNVYRLGGGGGNLVITAANTLTGTAAVDIDPVGTGGGVILTQAQNFSGAASVSGATLVLGGSAGSLTGTSGITLKQNGTLLLDNEGLAAGLSGTNGNRVANSVPITIQHGTIELRAENGSAGTTNTETLGAVVYREDASLRVGAVSGAAGAELSVQSLTRQQHGTLTLRTSALGTLGGVDRIKVTNAPLLTNGIVAPHLVSGTDAMFLGYGANGFFNAPFTSTDLNASLPTDVVDGPAGPFSIGSTATAYALRLGTGSVGGGSMNIRSGGLILNGSATHTSDVNFHDGSSPVEALIYAAPATTTTLGGNFNAQGLTKFGAGVLVLNHPTLGATLSGPIAVQAGTLSVGTDNVVDNTGFFPQFTDVEVNHGATLNLFESAAIRNLSGSGTIRLGNTNTARRTLGLVPSVNGTFSGVISNNNDVLASPTGTNGGVAMLHKGGLGRLDLRDARLNGVREVHVLNAELVFSGSTTFTELATRGRLEVHQGASFTIDNREVNNTDRLGLEYQSATEVGGYFRLSGGTFNYLGNATSVSTEVIGRVNGAVPLAPTWGPGNDVINVVIGGTSTPAAIAFTTNSGATNFPFVREQGASVLIRGTGLGQGVVGTTGVTNVLFTSAPTMVGGGGAVGSTGVSILPGVIASSVNGGTDTYGLATHDPGADGLFNSGDDLGVRRLTAAELTPTITEGAITSANVHLTAPATVATGATVNALHLGAGGSVNGAGIIQVTSGTVLVAGGANGGLGTGTPGQLEFSNVEAVFFAGSELAVGSVVSGLNGVTVGGPAKLTLSNAGNSFVGPITVNGHLAVAQDGALGAGSNPVNINYQGTLEFNGTFNSARPIRIGTPDTRINVPANASYQAHFAVSAGQTVNLSGGVSGGLGALTGGVSLSTGLRPDEAAALIKRGPGALILSGTEIYTGGTVVEAGLLAINGLLNIDSPVTVQGGGTLGGTGTIQGTVGVLAGGTLGAGDFGTGILRLGSQVTLSAGSTLAASVGHGALGLPQAGTEYDQLIVGTGGAGNSTAGVVLGNASLALTPLAGIQMNDVFYLILNDGADPVVGTFASLPQGAAFITAGQMFEISYEADSGGGTFTGGNDVAVRAVPEPSGALLLLGGLGCLLAGNRAGRRRRGTASGR